MTELDEEKAAKLREEIEENNKGTILNKSLRGKNSK